MPHFYLRVTWVICQLNAGYTRLYSVLIICYLGFIWPWVHGVRRLGHGGQPGGQELSQVSRVAGL